MGGGTGELVEWGGWAGGMGGWGKMYGGNLCFPHTPSYGRRTLHSYLEICSNRPSRKRNRPSRALSNIVSYSICNRRFDLWEAEC